MKITNNIGLSFEINKKDHTATIIGSFKAKGDILIPRSVSIQSQEFTISSIGQSSFKNNKNIKTIVLSNDSLIHSICKDAFSYSSIEKIIFSDKLTEIGESAFSWCQKLKTIEIPKNSSLCTIGKSAFAHSSIESFSIPIQLTEINDFTFSYCENMKSIQIPNNSQLHSIHKYAFSCSGIENIIISSKIVKLEEGWCAGTNKLVSFSISNENKMFKNVDNDFIVGKSNIKEEEFDELVFARRNIEEAIIPLNIKRIKSYCFSCCNNLKTIYFDSKTQIANIEKESFSFSSIENISIPNEIQEIFDGAFSYCKNLKTINISEESSLCSINKEAFSSSAIESILIPPKVTQIKEGAFSYCEKLHTVEIPEKSSLVSIGKDAFSHSSIESIFIPASLQILEEGWCAGTNKLVIFSISNENKMFKNVDNDFIVGKSNIKEEEFDELVFARRNIEEAIIPSNIKRIKSYCFSCCNNLKTIHFDPKTEITNIEKESFSFSTIENISIPNQIQEIFDGAFSFCDELKAVNFQENSSLKSINKEVFMNSALEFISIPPLVTEIKEHTFFNCKKLKIINFENNSLLKKINKEAFDGSPIETISFPFSMYKIISDFIKHFQISNIEIIDENIRINSLFKIQCIKSITFPNAKEIIIEKGCSKFTLFIPRNCDLIGDESSINKLEIKFISPKKMMKIEILEVDMIDNFLQNNEPFAHGLISDVYKIKINQEKKTDITNSQKKKKTKKTQKNKEIKKKKNSAKEIRTLKVFNKSSNENENTNQNNNEQIHQFNSDKMKRYISQCEILNSINHRNIIKIFGYYKGNDYHSPCILEEYFKSHLENSIKKLREIDIISIIFEISLVMKEVHQKGIIHRNLKPSNILLDAENHVKICDFNIDALMNVETQINFELKYQGNKNLKFYAPEIVKKEEKYDEKVDVYSFGMILLYVLTKGEFFAINIDEVISDKKLVIPKEINKISNFLIEKCLSYLPRERPSFIQIVDIILNNQFKLIDGIENDIPTIQKHLSLI